MAAVKRAVTSHIPSDWWDSIQQQQQQQQQQQHNSMDIEYNDNNSDSMAINMDDLLFGELIYTYYIRINKILIFYNCVIYFP